LRQCEPRGKADKAIASSAMMPPSPRLSARSIRITYFSVTTTISAQKIVDTVPRTFASLNSTPPCSENTSFTVYSGLVPMSPYTTPIAARHSAASLRSRVLPVLPCMIAIPR